MSGFSLYDIDLAKNVQNKYNIPASVTLAQYALESGYGTSNLAKKNNNYFGVRSGKGWAKYGNKADSFNSYGKLMSSPTYTSKTKNSKNVAEYVENMSETYAPSSDGNSNYSGKILSIINKNNLTQYDSGKYGDMKTITGSPKFSANLLTFVLFIFIAYLAYRFFDAMIGGVEQIKIIKDGVKNAYN